MNVPSGTTRELYLPNVRVQEIPLATVDVGEYVRWSILDKYGTVVSSGNMAFVVGTVCDWRAYTTMPSLPGRYEVVFTIMTDMGNDETAIRVEVDPRKVPVA